MSTISALLEFVAGLILIAPFNLIYAFVLVIFALAIIIKLFKF